VPKNHHDTLKHGIERHVKLGVLKRCSNSEWAAPTLIIPKKNGTVRFISDFRKLNEMLKKNALSYSKHCTNVAGIRKKCLCNFSGFEHGILHHHARL
jgi:hypothetical protein